MKRGGPLKRTGALARTGAPARGPLKRTGRPKPPKLRARRSDADAALAALFHQAVTRAGRCAWCRQRGTGLNPIEAHHVVEKGWLRRNGFAEVVVWDPANGMPLCRRCHERHTKRLPAAPRYLLARSNWRFAAKHGITWYLERTYPEP